MTYHTTVLLNAGVDELHVRRGGVYVDATFGGGGHSRELLNRLEGGRLFAFDQDEAALSNAPTDSRFQLFKANFRHMRRFLLAEGVQEIDGLIADLGVSGHQFDEADRGFSFRFSANLDMRMNRGANEDAAQLLNTLPQEELKKLFAELGESRFASAVAKAIVAARATGPIEHTDQLTASVAKAVPPHKLSGELPKIYQALRIAVNDELGALRELLEQSAVMIRSSGRLVVISYHSLEDRPVKHYIRSGNFDDKPIRDVYGAVQRPFDPVGKVVVPTEAEILHNPRSRSAKMRVAQRR